LPISKIELLSIERLPDIHAQTTPFAPLSAGEPNNFKAATVVGVNHSLGPWSIELSDGRKATPFPADLLGFAYFAQGLPSTLSLAQLSLFEYLGAVLCLVVLVVTIACVVRLPGRVRLARLPFFSYRTRRD
jgi:hypothetical protein